MSEIGGIDNSAQIAAEEARRRAEEEARKRAEEEARKKAEEEAKNAEEAKAAQEAEEAEKAQEKHDIGATAGSIWNAYESGEISQTQAAQYISQLSDGFEFGPTAEQSVLVQNLTETQPVSETEEIQQIQQVAADELRSFAQTMFPDKTDWTNEEIVQAVTLSYISQMNDNIAQTLNSPDSYGWTGELRNSVVELLGYDDSYQDLQNIINVQEQGMGLLEKAISGDLTQSDIFEYSKDKLSTDPNYFAISDAVEYLPPDLVMDWAQNGIPDDIQVFLYTRTSDGFGSYNVGTEPPPPFMTDVVGISVYNYDADLLGQRGNVSQEDSDYTVDETYTIHYNDKLQPSVLEESEANKPVDFESAYKLVQGTEYNPETIAKFLDSAQALNCFSEPLNSVTEFTNNIAAAETYTDLVNVFIAQFGDEDTAINELNKYLHDTVNPVRENFNSDEEYQAALGAVAVEYGIGTEIKDLQVRKNNDGTYSIIRTYNDGTEYEDDSSSLESICNPATSYFNNFYYYKVLDDSIKSQYGVSLEDFTKEYEEALFELAGPAKQLDNFIKNYDKDEKNAVNVVAGVGTTAAVIAALALAPVSGGSSLALLGTLGTGASSLGTSVMVATIAGGTTNTLIRGTNTASKGEEYTFDQGLKDFLHGGVQGAIIPLSAGVFKLSYEAAAYGSSYLLSSASNSGTFLASLARSPLASSGARIVTSAVSAGAAGEFAGGLNSANDYLYYTENPTFSGLMYETEKGSFRGGTIGILTGFGYGFISELPALSNAFQNSLSSSEINVIPGYNAYIVNSDGSMGLIPSGSNALVPQNSSSVLVGNNALALSQGEALALPYQNTGGLYPLALPVSPAQVSYANALLGTVPNPYLLPQAATVETPSNILKPMADKPVDYFPNHSVLMGNRPAVESAKAFGADIMSYDKKGNPEVVFSYSPDGKLIGVENYEHTISGYDILNQKATYTYKLPDASASPLDADVLTEKDLLKPNHGIVHTVEYDVVMQNPNNIAFSQGQVQQSGYESLVKALSKGGWKGMPIEAVQLPNGSVVSMDNRRLLAARNAGMEEVPVVVHSADEPLNMANMHRFNVKMDDPTKGSQTWGEAIRDRLYENGLLNEWLPVSDVGDIVSSSNTPLVTNDQEEFLRSIWNFPQNVTLNEFRGKFWNELMGFYSSQ